LKSRKWCKLCGWLIQFGGCLNPNCPSRRKLSKDIIGHESSKVPPSKVPAMAYYQANRLKYQEGLEEAMRRQTLKKKGKVKPDY